MEKHSIILTVFIIFAGAALFSTLALYMRQSLLVAYMLFGVAFGPWGFKTITDVDLVNSVDEIGIIFFMFLLGLQLHPQSLLRMISKTAWITLLSSLIFFIFGFMVGYWYGYNLAENLIIGACMTFSSTIVSLKLLPANIARDKRVNEIMVSVLLLQDLIAIIVLLAINTTSHGKMDPHEIVLIILSLPSILFFVFVVERLVLSRIFATFTEVREYMLLVAVSWCLGVAVLANLMGLSYEIGAFIAGISIAASPIALCISEQIKPIRDFFLVLFFFIIGASFNLHYLGVIIVPAIILTAIFIILKPLIFHYLLHYVNEIKHISLEVGWRLGQLSEFSLLVVILAYRSELVGHSVIYLIQAVTMFMFIISSYIVVTRYPIKTSLEKLLEA